MRCWCATQTLDIDNYCLVTPFWFAYYGIDLRETLRKWVALHPLGFPSLAWKGDVAIGNKPRKPGRLPVIKRCNV